MNDTGNRFTLRINRNNFPKIEEISLMLFFSGNAILYLINGLFRIIGLPSLGTYGVLFVKAITLVGIIVGLLRLKRTLLAKSIFLLFGIILLFLVSYLLNPEIGEWLRSSYYGITRVFGLHGHIFSGGVVAFLIIIIQKDPEKILRGLKVSTVILLIYLLITLYNRIVNGYFVLDDEGVIRNSAYNMGVGYYCTFVSTTCYMIWFTEKKKIYLIISVLFAIFSVSFGSRGVIISYALFAILMLWTTLRDSSIAKKALIILVVLTAVVIILINYSRIILGIQYLLSSIGVSNSRTLSKLVSNEFMEGNGRDVLWPWGISLIKERFPFGYGVFGERPIIGSTFKYGYIHNIVLEIILEFGIIGILLLIYFIYKSFKLVNYNIQAKWKALFILFLANTGMLMVSNSFWYCPYFWAAIATGVLYGKSIKADKQIN